MRSPLQILLSVLVVMPLAASAQPAPKVYVVDVARVFEGHPQTQSQQAALKADEQKAGDQLKAIERDIRAMADRLKEKQSRFDDPTLAASQRDAVRAEGQKIATEMQARQNEGQQLMMKAQNEFQQRVQKFRGQILADIAKASAEVARRKGGTIVHDRGSLVYADPAYDITSEVLAEVAKARPQAPAATKGAPAAPR